MRTGTEVGKLYAYFLEACARFIYRDIHKQLGIRDPGEGMYEDLVRLLAGGCRTRYRDKIMEHEHFSDTQRACLTPADGIIDKEKLDFTIYVQIYSILGRSIFSNPMKFMINTRNRLCHRSLVLLRQNMTESYFYEEWQVMRWHFQRLNLEKQFLDWCDIEIR